MKTNLSFAEIREILSTNYSQIAECGVINIGILTHIYDQSNDAELYATFNNTCNSLTSFMSLLNVIEKIFPNYQVDVYHEDDADNLNQSIIDGIYFI